MAAIDDVSKAARLARAIASDIALYNADKVTKSLTNDRFYEDLATEFEEGRKLYQSRLAEHIDTNSHLFERAVIDVILIKQGHIACKVW